MSNQTSLVTEAARTAAAQNTSDYANSVAVHVSGDYGQHNQVAVYDTIFSTLSLAAGATYAAHNIPLTKSLRFLVTINDVNYAIIVPGIPGATFSGGGTNSGSPNANAPAFTTQPASAVITAGASAALTVVLTGTAPIFLQWFKSGVAVSGATSTSLTISNFQAADAGNYLCIATNSVGQTISSTAVLSLANSSGGGTTPTRPGTGSDLGGGCFTKNTRITMANGVQQPITAVSKGDMLRSLVITGLAADVEESWRLFSQNIIAATVVETRVREVVIDTFTYYYIINGDLEVTYEHPLLCKRGSLWRFIRAQDVQQGDYLFKNGGAVLIRTIQRVDTTISTWNFNVEPYDIFIANGYIVHNLVQKT